MNALETASKKYGVTSWEIDPALLILENPTLGANDDDANKGKTIAEWLTDHSYTIDKNKVSWG